MWGRADIGVLDNVAKQDLFAEITPFRFAQGFSNIPENLFRGSLSYCGLQIREVANRRELPMSVLNQLFYKPYGRLSGGRTHSQHIARIFQTSCNGLEQDGSK